MLVGLREDLLSGGLWLELSEMRWERASPV